MFKNGSSPKKSELTRQGLFDIAIEMIAKKGFEATTMRAIAAKAGVAPGAIYYYYRSKESLIYEYYQQSQVDLEETVSVFLKSEKHFAKRLHHVVTRRIQLAMPYKEMARALFRVAANPSSPLSPFSDESKKVRLEALGTFNVVVNGSQDKFDHELKELLPPFLWLFQMGVILFWIYDNSEKSVKTFELIDKSVPLIDSFNKMIQSPLATPFKKKILSTLKTFTPDLGQSTKNSKERTGAA